MRKTSQLKVAKSQPAQLAVPTGLGNLEPSVFMIVVANTGTASICDTNHTHWLSRGPELPFMSIIDIDTNTFIDIQ